MARASLERQPIPLKNSSVADCASLRSLGAAAIVCWQLETSAREGKHNSTPVFVKVGVAVFEVHQANESVHVAPA